MESLLFLLGLLLGVILGAVGAVVLLGRLRREPEDDDRDQLREAWHAAQLDAEAAKARLQALEQRRDDDAEPPVNASPWWRCCTRCARASPRCSAASRSWRRRGPRSMPR
ncbi:hypothetical protein [Nesterenkonia sp. PF2B19]|uniref:hypothetical protein n=1 Tax=Nesterenkonia sp. PF2B19 TaxID=1881858 RepID=UPI00111C6E90|nr:hypothetical protein [Nesterenkonia sp. PF2B19]